MPQRKWEPPHNNNFAGGATLYAWMPCTLPHLHVFDVAQVAILGGEQKGPGLIQLCFYLKALIVQQRELRLQNFVLQRLLHCFLRQAP